MDALINDGLSLGLVQHPPALKLLAAEAALRDVGLVQGVSQWIATSKLWGV